MKITRRQLAQIIREEARSLAETPIGRRRSSRKKPLSALLRELADAMEAVEEDPDEMIETSLIDEVIRRLEQFRG